MKNTLTKDQDEKLDRAFENIHRRAKEIALNSAGDDKFDVYFKITDEENGRIFFDVEGSNTDTLEWIRDPLIDIIKEELRWSGITFEEAEEDGNREGVFWIYAQF